jgi:hypothetical protein
MEQKDLFQIFLGKFEKAEFPLTLAYDVNNAESFSDEPLSEVLVNMFIAEDDSLPHSNAGDFIEYIPAFTFDLSKKYKACIIFKMGLGIYEFQLFIYDQEGNIMQFDAVAGTYFDPYDPNQKLNYQVCEFKAPDKAIIIKGEFSTTDETFNPAESQKFILTISDTGELNYAIIKPH